MVTEAVRQVLGDRVIGICDTPSGLCRRVARALGHAPEEMWFDYFGLNHLGWLQAASDSTGDRLPELLADDAALAGFEEGRLFGGDWLRALGMIPNEYLYYFYFGADTVSTDPGAGAAARRLPARVPGGLLRRRTAQAPAEALGAWRATRDERDRTYMAEARSAAGRHRRARRRRRGGRLRGRGAGARRGDRQQHPRDPDPQHRQPLRAAVPRRARGRRGARDRGPRRPGAGRDRADAARTRRRSSRRSRTSSARRSRRR